MKYKKRRSTKKKTRFGIDNIDTNTAITNFNNPHGSFKFRYYCDSVHDFVYDIKHTYNKPRYEYMGINKETINEVFGNEYNFNGNFRDFKTNLSEQYCKHVASNTYNIEHKRKRTKDDLDYKYMLTLGYYCIKNKFSIITDVESYSAPSKWRAADPLNDYNIKYSLYNLFIATFNDSNPSRKLPKAGKIAKLFNKSGVELKTIKREQIGSSQTKLTRRDDSVVWQYVNTSGKIFKSITVGTSGDYTTDGFTLFRTDFKEQLDRFLDKYVTARKVSSSDAKGQDIYKWGEWKWKNYTDSKGDKFAIGHDKIEYVVDIDETKGYQYKYIQEFDGSGNPTVELRAFTVEDNNTQFNHVYYKRGWQRI